MCTRQQVWAEKAYAKVKAVENTIGEEDYGRFCKGFPALIHSAGLCQAVAFAEAKEKDKYLEDLAAVLGKNKDDLAHTSRLVDVVEYQQLSRDAMAVATWLKRYAEALLKGR